MAHTQAGDQASASDPRLASVPTHDLLDRLRRQPDDLGLILPELYRRFAPMVERVSIELAGSPEAAEGVIVDAWTEMFSDLNRLEKLRSGAQFARVLKAVAMRYAFCHDAASPRSEDGVAANLSMAGLDQVDGVSTPADRRARTPARLTEMPKTGQGAAQ